MTISEKRKKILRGISRLCLALFLMGCCVAFGFGAGFEFGTGLPAITLITATQSEPASIPETLVVKTTEEAKQVVEEAVTDKVYDIGYNCLDYAWDSMRALHWDGQPATMATIIYESGKGHAIVLAATTDGNWTFLDPKTGIELHPVPGGFWAGKKIVSVKVMVMHLVDFEDFEKNPAFGVQE